MLPDGGRVCWDCVATVGCCEHLWELFEVNLGLGGGGKKIWGKGRSVFERGLCERLGKLRWIVVKLAGVTQGSVVVRAEEFQGYRITRW